MPKEETRSSIFLQSYPQFDGRGIVIGILDTGVDPGSIGLQVTTEGKPKVIDIVDCSGAGDVDTTEVYDANGQIRTFRNGGKDDGGKDDKTALQTPEGGGGGGGGVGEEGTLAEGAGAASSSGVPLSGNESSSLGVLSSSSSPAPSLSSSSSSSSLRLPGKSGRTLFLSPTVDCPSGIFRLGLKRAYDFFPAALVERLKKERAKKADKEHLKQIAGIRKQVKDIEDDMKDKDKSKATTAGKSNDNAAAKPKTREEEQVSVVGGERGGGASAGAFVSLATAASPPPPPSALSPPTTTTETETTRRTGGDDESPEAKAKAAKAMRDNLEQSCVHLTSVYSSYVDPGPIYDCVVYMDSNSDWQSLVDTTETGDLTFVSPMCDYRKKREFRPFCSSSLLNFVVNITSDGNVLSLTTDCGAHGTHVASIAAGHHPGVPSMDGVAPGAQIISLKVGDSRLGSMETGTAVTRAMIEAVRRGCHVVNMSYGEATSSPDVGRVVELAAELVGKYNVVFVASAGNNGPCLSTVGAPGGTSSAILSVGAFVSSAMMTAEYSMRQHADTPAARGANYTWSSAGPTADGDIGVDVIAPGGAIAGVPNWCLQKNQLMNGTSMSSPNCAGCVALLLSGLYANQIPYTANRIRSAVCTTASKMQHLEDVVQGCGMVQVDAAFDYLLKFAAIESEDVFFKVTLSNRAGTGRGVYLRQPEEVSKVQTFTVEVSPEFSADDNNSFATQRSRVNFEMLVNFGTTTPAPFVSFPEHLVLMHNGRNFVIEIDPTRLPPGLHFTKLCGYDSQNPERGAIFSFPITIAKPFCVDARSPSPNLGLTDFAPAQASRFFLEVPVGATWMDVTVKDMRDPKEDSSTRMIVLATVQLLPNTPYRDAESNEYLNLLPGEVSVKSVRVEPGVTVELVLARVWSALGATSVTCDAQFRGVTPSPTSVVVGPGAAGHGGHVRLLSLVRDEVVLPVARLSKWRRRLAPSRADISPLGERDVLVDGKQIYSLIVTYEMKLEEAAGVTVRLPILNGVLYESPFEAQMVMIYDSSKKLLGVSDAFPKEIKCDKGAIEIRAEVRHDSIPLLENLKNMLAVVERDIKGGGIELACYKSQYDLATKGKKVAKKILRLGMTTSVFFDAPDTSKIPESAEPGDILVGSVNYEYKDTNLAGKGQRPDGWDVSFDVPVFPKKKEAEKAAVSVVPDTRSEAEKMAEALRDWKVARVEKMVGNSKFDELYAVIVAEYPDHLPLLAIGLKHSDSEDKRSSRLQKVVDLADAIISKIDDVEIANWFGLKHDATDGLVVKKGNEMTALRATLVDALARKCRALMDTDETTKKERGGGKGGSTEDGAKKGVDGEGEAAASDTPPPPPAAAAAAAGADLFTETMKSLKKWETIEKNDKFAIFDIELAKRRGHYGEVLAIIDKLGDGEGTKSGLLHLKKADLLKMRIEIYEKMGWENLCEYDRKWKVLNTLEKYALF